MQNPNFLTEDSSSNIHDISEWNQLEVLSWVREINLSNLTSNFEENKINGYDLCKLTHAILKEELRISSFHDRNVILRSIEENLIRQCIYFPYKLKTS